MTLIELLVALSILGLALGLAFSSMGPWLRQARLASEEAGFWRSIGPARLALAEIAAGAINVDETLVVTADEARLRAYAPRLAPIPIDIALRVETSGDRSRLVLSAPALVSESVLLTNAPPLRFRPPSADEPPALVLQAQVHRTWAVLAHAPLPVDGPLACAFDAISRSCR